MIGVLSLVGMLTELGEIVPLSSATLAEGCLIGVLAMLLLPSAGVLCGETGRAPKQPK